VAVVPIIGKHKLLANKHWLLSCFHQKDNATGPALKTCGADALLVLDGVSAPLLPMVNHRDRSAISPLSVDT